MSGANCARIEAESGGVRKVWEGYQARGRRDQDVSDGRISITSMHQDDIERGFSFSIVPQLEGASRFGGFRSDKELVGDNGRHRDGRPSTEIDLRICQTDIILPLHAIFLRSVLHSGRRKAGPTIKTNTLVQITSFLDLRGEKSASEKRPPQKGTVGVCQNPLRSVSDGKYPKRGALRTSDLATLGCSPPTEAKIWLLVL